MMCPCHHVEVTLVSAMQPEEPPRPYPDVDSFIAALEARHEAILEDVDTSSPDGRQMEVRGRPRLHDA